MQVHCKKVMITHLIDDPEHYSGDSDYSKEE